MSPSSAAFGERVLIIGNSGSGKSTLAARLAARTAQPVFDLDLIHWHADGRKRDAAASREAVAGLASGPGWIIEGVYGWLAVLAVPCATALIWIDLPWAACRDGLLARGLRRGMTQDDQTALLAWAEAYWTRSTPSSFSGHARLFSDFSGPKVRFCERSDIDAFDTRLGIAIRTDPSPLGSPA